MAKIESYQGVFRIYDDSRDALVQVDYDLPGVARNMGWDLAACVPSLDEDEEDMTDDERRRFQQQEQCFHHGTDGTVPCPHCGLPALTFIASARAWIEEHEDEEFEGLDAYLDNAH